jgi:hypothetical protein
MPPGKRPAPIPPLGFGGGTPRRRRSSADVYTEEKKSRSRRSSVDPPPFGRPETRSTFAPQKHSPSSPAPSYKSPTKTPPLPPTKMSPKLLNAKTTPRKARSPEEVEAQKTLLGAIGTIEEVEAMLGVRNKGDRPEVEEKMNAEQQRAFVDSAKKNLRIELPMSPLSPGFMSPRLPPVPPTPATTSTPSVAENESKHETAPLTPKQNTDDTGAEVPVGENLEHNHKDDRDQMFVDMLTDSVARGTARALAGVPQAMPARPTEAVASGYMGTRNVENSDIKNSSAAGTAPVGKAADRGGDAFILAKESHNTTTDTLRPTFGIAPANAVIPTKTDQIKSDILFADFSVVAPGNGLGVTNKMFLMEEYRDKEFRFKEPLAEPRSYDGPTGGALPPPLQLQNEITRRDRSTLRQQSIAAEATGALLERRAGEGSLNIHGDDFGMFQQTSDKGLKRHSESPLEPQIKTPKAWERVKGLPGIEWSRKQMRRLFDSQRYPERFNVNMAMDGGPIMNKRSALAVYPFPITSN